MSTFLQSVAKDIYTKFGENLSDVIVVFPNKRASLFLNKYLHQLIGHSFWSPQYITISQLFRQQSNKAVADQIKTICILYKAFCQCTGSSETLDQFWGWGQLMLADFDDLDKNMGDASQIYVNVSDHHELDTYDYLTDSQKEILKHLFNTFNGGDDSQLRQRFLLFWNKLYDVYTTFNTMMAQDGLAYEGSLYREVAEKAEQLQWDGKKYLFVGFNMIQECEKKIFLSIHHSGKAMFYWDFDRYYTENRNQEAGKFISEYLRIFPNELDRNDDDLYDNFSKQKDISYYSAATENIQARFISDWLKSNGRMEAMERTAIVLCDESLLKSVIHHLPEELSGKVNITVGYPLSQTLAVALVKNFISMHVYGYNGTHYNANMVNLILHHPYARYISPAVEDLIKEIEDTHIYFPKPTDLCKDEGLQMLFTPFEGEDCQNDQQRNAAMMKRLQTILKTIGTTHENERLEELAMIGVDPDEAAVTYEEQFLQESVFRMHTVVTRFSDLIEEGILTVNQHTLLRLIDQVVQSVTMPFHGEPAVGIQIMGVLETRNLDFDHVLMLSCNEGNLPKGISDSSLIPHSIRKAFNLTTVENKVAIYAYYFYRLLQRAGDIGITYNSSTEDGHTGQMSRFMLQLMVELKDCQLKQFNLTAQQKPHELQINSVEKNERIMEKLMSIRSMSPTAISTYLRCPLMFYYQQVNGLTEPLKADISDTRTFGNIFHKSAQMAYKEIATQDGLVTADALDKLINEKGDVTITRFVDEAFSEEFSQNEKLKYDGLQLINRQVICRLLKGLLQADKRLAPFHIIGTECSANENITFEIPDYQQKTIRIGGSIDRLDCINTENGGQVLRVVDYKTGMTEPKVPAKMEDVFSQEGISNNLEYYLQTMLYSIVVRHFNTPRQFPKNTFRKYQDAPDSEMSTFRPLNPQNLPVQPALLFIQKPESVNDPILKMTTTDPQGKAVTTKIDDIVNYEPKYREELKKLLGEIFDPTKPFTMTVKADRCKYCAYKNICKGSR